MVPPSKYADIYDRKTTLYDSQSGRPVTKPYLEPPPPFTTPSSSYSSVYYDPPAGVSPDPVSDKMDDHIEVFELTFGSNDTKATKDFEFNHPPVDNNDILKDYYIGDSTRRPNSYFYDELSDGEMKESVTVTQMTKRPTPSPEPEPPLPTYKAYTDQYQSSETTPTTAAPPTTTSTTYFPSTEPTRRFSSAPQTTFQPFFQQGGKAATTPLSTVRLGTTPAIRFTSSSTTTYDPMTFGKDQTNGQKDEERDQATKSFSKVYQQIGSPVSINVTHPDDKSWERLVTLKPELNRKEEILLDDPVPVSISTTQAPPLRADTTLTTTEVFVTTPAWNRDDLKINKKPQMDNSEPETGGLTTRRNFTTRTKVKPLPGYLETPTKTKAYSFNSGIQWGRPQKNGVDPIKMSIKRNYKKKFQGGKRRNGATNRPNWLKRKTTRSPLRVTGTTSDDDEEGNLVQTPSVAPPTMKSKLPSAKFSTTSVAPKKSAKPKKFNISKTLNKIIENSSTLTTLKPRQFVTNNQPWSATKKPPPRGITTPGWHIHSNADLRNRRKLQRSQDAAEDSTAATSKINHNKVKMPSLSKDKIFNKIDKLKQKRTEMKGRSLRAPYNSRVRMLKFTADDAIESEDEEATTADSRSYMSIAPYNFKSQISRQREILLPEKAARRMDTGGNRRKEAASYKITPNLRSGGYQISPIRRNFQGGAPRRPYQDGRKAVRSYNNHGHQQRNFNTDHTWLLRSPDGIEFHFQNLKQIYDLNQNNFVPG